ncbi:MAG: MarR family winged helix-turn-helix transcriptional regulator [Parvibaculaceae bacterium]
MSDTRSADRLPRPCPDTVDAWAQLLRASQKLLKRVEADLKRADLPPLSWYDVLRELDAAEGRRLHQFEIEAQTAMTQYNLSRLLDRLETQELVRRDGCPNDRRANFVSLTPAGRRLKTRMWEVYEQSIARHFGCALAGAEARSLAALLRPITAGN